MNTIPLAFMVSQLGASFATRNAARRLNKTDVIECLERHMLGDWGEVDDFDWKTNDDGGRVWVPNCFVLCRSEEESVSDRHGSGSFNDNDPAPGRILS